MCKKKLFKLNVYELHEIKTSVKKCEYLERINENTKKFRGENVKCTITYCIVLSRNGLW